MQAPFIGLGPVARSPVSLNELPKGDIIPWQPTDDDLTRFLGQIMRWLDPGKGRARRHAVLLCGGTPVPYATSIQEVSTGVKITQLCVGNTHFHPDDLDTRGKPAAYAGLSTGNIVLSARIGGLKYVHRLTDLDDVFIDSSRDNSGFSANKGLIENQEASGVSFVRLWFDSWKATGTWSHIGVPPSLTEKPQGDSVVLVGPIGYFAV